MSTLENLRARLRVAEQQLAISMDHAPIGMSVVDNDDRLVRVNDALCHLLGYSEPDLLGRSWMDLTHPADLTVGAAEIAAMFAGDRPSGDRRGLRGRLRDLAYGRRRRRTRR